MGGTIIIIIILPANWIGYDHIVALQALVILHNWYLCHSYVLLWSSGNYIAASLSNAKSIYLCRAAAADHFIYGDHLNFIHDRRCAPGNVSGGTLAVALEINYQRYCVGGLAFVGGVWFCSAAISIRTELAGSVSIAKRECQSLIQVVVVEYSDSFSWSISSSSSGECEKRI